LSPKKQPPGARAPQRLVPNWPAPQGVFAFTTLRGSQKESSQTPEVTADQGEELEDAPQIYRENRHPINVLLPNPPRWLNQIHSSLVIGPDNQEPHPSCDGAWTGEDRQPLAILTADCLPILMTDFQGGTIAALHGGWRGLASGIIDQGLGAFNQDVLAWVGPGIGPESYEVDRRVRDPFLDRYPVVESAFLDRGKRDHWHLDLYQASRLIFQQAGVDRVYSSRWDTYSQERLFYSYRRQNPTGRMATVIWKDSSEN
jgi:YfiH family protein